MKAKGHKDLVVWQKSMDAVVLVYRLTENFPKEEIYGLTSQMRRSAVSIPSNIAEGRKRGSDVEFKRFLTYAYGSAAELETQIEIALRLRYVNADSIIELVNILDEVLRMLNKMTSS